MESRDRDRLEWAFKLGVVFPLLMVVAAVYVKSWMTGWPVGPGGAALMAVFIGYAAFCHLFSNNRAVLTKVILLVWSASGAGLAGWIAFSQVKKLRDRPEPPPPSQFVGNQIAGYLENAPPWWATYAAEFQQAWHMKWHPYLRWRHLPFSGECIRINELGRRETWNPPQPATNRHRIFTFGGSVMWGTGARNEFTIASHISRGLNEAGVPVEVTNFSEAGYVTTQEVMQLIFELRAGNIPRVVVFLDGVNDIFSAFQNREAGVPQNEATMRTMLQELLDKKHRDINPGKVAAPIVAPAGSEMTDAELIDKELANYVGNLALVEMLARHFEFEALYYWQPVAFTGKTLTSDEIQRVAKQGVKMAEFVRLAYTRVPALKPPGQFHDLSGIFNSVTNSLYLDLCHFREEGNELLARPMVRDLAHLLSKPRSSQ